MIVKAPAFLVNMIIIIFHLNPLIGEMRRVPSEQQPIPFVKLKLSLIVAFAVSSAVQPFFTSFSPTFGENHLVLKIKRGSSTPELPLEVVIRG